MTGEQRSPEIISPVRRIGRREFDFDRQVAVMAIVNRTPNSFHDQGRTFELDHAVAAATKAVDEGADWVDIGGFAFSAAQASIGVQEEIDRVAPVISKVRGATDAVISVDTHRPEVAAAALEAGADVINDTNGLREPGMAEVAASTGACVVVTHSLGGPGRRVFRPSYTDVVAEVAGFLRERVAAALAAGIAPDRIIIDPGHDLNKNTFHSLELTRRLEEITAIGHPTLVALSNKDFIGETLDRPQGERKEGTIAANVISILKGARILRVHDVAATVASVRMTEAVLGWRGPVAPSHNLA
ncbi:Non functional Dihydropteroate synthase 2 [[Actinomadura] parvosata subsp. kistnae]|uniref:Dihydropteroate synthase n=1 Tax=[Actinomadura] parvosata subsp. kistnae TaxID=1909395 RepID=A0A1V0AD18_9ACTN|nr:dihydropteroate synthase [Nonomuraea sp. ATCC 55076]AQZ68097.1 dihydropteroate synthase [Nonomuraea sp. ATCC 55076]SPL93522.1 Non functional Dihydropteroate synthase 2 [Actinomadura parvosata subsp. kistnae]